jgi:hypothetical protein
MLVTMTLVFVSYMFAQFLAAWGTSSFLDMYVPQFPTSRKSLVGEAFILLVLYSPLIYATSILMYSKRRKQR